jgi:hypothetical protein
MLIEIHRPPNSPSHVFIYSLQVKAVIHAAAESKQQGFDPQPEIMVPLVSIEKELRTATELVHATAKRELQALGRWVGRYVLACSCSACLSVCVRDSGGDGWGAGGTGSGEPLCCSLREITGTLLISLVNNDTSLP